MLGLTRTDDGSYTHHRDPGEFAYGNKVPRVSVSEEEAEILGFLSAGKSVLEIGTGLGISTRAMARTAKELTTVDNDPWVHENIWPTISWAKHVRTRSDRPSTDWFDLIFIDGDHRKEAVLRDIATARSCSKPRCDGGTLIVFHDVKYSNVGDVVRESCTLMRVLDTAHGLGLVWAKDLL